MLLGHAYFAVGNYRESAAATQAAICALPQSRWGVVITSRNELYGDLTAYNRQLGQLKNAVDEDPNDAALRFLLGYHYAYLGYPQSAVVQLNKVIELEPRDEIAAQLRNSLAPRLPAAGAPVITPGALSVNR
jgi:tetratricopeptide (TPR) repeat protein